MLKLRVITLVSLLLLVVAVGCSSSEPTATSEPTPDQEIEDISIKIIDIERRRTLMLEESEQLIFSSPDAIAYGQRAEFGNLSELLNAASYAESSTSERWTYGSLSA